MNPDHIRTTPHRNRNPTRSRTFTVNFFSKPITTIVTATPAVAREWVYTLRHNYHQQLLNHTLVIGLGVQWKATFTTGDPPKAATLQLCVDSDCLIFQLSHANAVPATLRRLLSDKRVTFVGVHNGRDKKVLERSRHALEVGSRVVDLAVEQKWGKSSMEKMAEYFLGTYDVVKPRELGTSEWDEFWLSNEQVQYACVDALVSYLIAERLNYPSCMFLRHDWSNFWNDHDDDDDNDDDDDDSGGGHKHVDDLWSYDDCYNFWNDDDDDDDDDDDGDDDYYVYDDYDYCEYFVWGDDDGSYGLDLDGQFW